MMDILGPLLLWAVPFFAVAYLLDWLLNRKN